MSRDAAAHSRRRPQLMAPSSQKDADRSLGAQWRQSRVCKASRYDLSLWLYTFERLSRRFFAKLLERGDCRQEFAAGTRLAGFPVVD